MNQNPNQVSVSQRNYGIDLLRLVAAFYVIILHTMNHGGLYQNTTPYSYQDLLCRILLIISFCAVNIFGIISGYVGYREPLKKITFSGYLPLWLTVVFYCVLFNIVYMCLLPGTVTSRDFVMSLFPLTHDLFWYFSAYTMVYFLSPFLNRILYYSSEKELKQLFFFICCILVTLEYINQSFAMEKGYSGIWLLLLYLIGGIMKKTGIGSRIPSYAALLAILLIDILYFFLGLKQTDLTIFTLSVSFNFRRSYITPFYLAAAILHVILFSRFRFGPLGQKIIKFAAPAAFSVYIANTNPSFWDNFMPNRFASWATSSPAGIFVRTIVFSLGFVLAVVFIDFLRQQLFRLLGVNTWVQKVSSFFQKQKAA